MVLGGEPIEFGADAEQRRQEILQRRRQGDEQVGFVLAGQRLRRRPRRHQASEQGGVRLFHMAAEQRVDARQTVSLVQVGEGQPMGQGELFHRRGVPAAVSSVAAL